MIDSIAAHHRCLFCIERQIFVRHGSIESILEIFICIPAFKAISTPDRYFCNCRTKWHSESFHIIFIDPAVYQLQLMDISRILVFNNCVAVSVHCRGLRCW